jgi:hypothetical protein
MSEKANSASITLEISQMIKILLLYWLHPIYPSYGTICAGWILRMDYPIFRQGLERQAVRRRSIGWGESDENAE